MLIHCKIAGILMILLALIHIIFPRYFRWKEELASLSLINRQLMYVHTFFVALTVLLMGLGCIVLAEDLITTGTGRTLSTGLALFWGIRLLFQFFVYSPRTWKGKVFETSMHVLFSFVWLYFTIVFTLIACK